MSKGLTNGPLNGARILDLTHVWAGPLAVRFLADLGAEVVRVEPPMGRGPKAFPYAPLGGWLGSAAGDDPWNTNAIFVKLMRNRRGLSVDLKTAEGKAVFLQLVSVADVVIENFSANAMDRLGLGHDVLVEANPHIINVSMPGFENSGPLAQRVAFGPTVEAMAGLTDVLGYDADDPRNTAMALMDPISATHAFAAVTQALQHKKDSGQGCRIEMSLHEGGVNYMGPWLIDRQLGNPVETWGNRHPGIVPHGVYRCQGDDQWVAIACQQQSHWQKLTAVLNEEVGTQFSADLDLDARRKIETEIDEALTTLTTGTSKHEISQRLQTAGIAAGPVNTTPDMAADEQTIERGFFVNYERHATPMPGNPIKMAGLDSDDWLPCPGLGEHNDEVLRDWLGYDQPQIDELATVLHNEPPL